MSSTSSNTYKVSNSLNDEDSSTTSTSSIEICQADLSPIFPYIQVGKELQDLRKDVFKLYQNLAMESIVRREEEDPHPSQSEIIGGESFIKSTMMGRDFQEVFS